MYYYSITQYKLHLNQFVLISTAETGVARVMEGIECCNVESSLIYS